MIHFSLTSNVFMDGRMAGWYLSMMSGKMFNILKLIPFPLIKDAIHMVLRLKSRKTIVGSFEPI